METASLVLSIISSIASIVAAFFAIRNHNDIKKISQSNNSSQKVKGNNNTQTIKNENVTRHV